MSQQANEKQEPTKKSKLTAFQAIMLWLVILSFVIFGFAVGGGGFGGGPGSDNAVALDVDGDTVTRRDFLRRLRGTEESYRRQFGESAERFLAQINVRQIVLNGLVTRAVALREARRIGLEVSDQELRNHIITTYVDESGTFIGRERLERQASRSGYNEADFRAALRDDLLYGKFQSIIDASVVVTADEVKSEYLERNDRAVVDYVRLEATALASSLSPSDDELKAFFAASPELFEVQQRKARYVTLTAEKYVSSVTLTDDDLRAEYDGRKLRGEYTEQRHARHILLKKDDKSSEELTADAKSLVDRALAGESFEELAKEHSTDQGSAVNGGDLGFFGRGRMVASFEEAVFSMSPGDVVGPIESTFGLHIIKLEEIQAPKAFDEVSDAIRTELGNQRALPLAREAAETALAKHAEAGGIDALAAELELTVLESGFLSANETPESIGDLDGFALSGFARSLFAIDAPNQLASQPLMSATQAILILYDESRTHAPTFDEAQGRVLAEYRQSKGDELVKSSATALQAAMDDGKTMEEAAEASDLEVQTSARFSPDGFIPGVPGSEEAVAAAYVSEVGTASRAFDLPDGALFYRLKERFEFDQTAFDGESDAIRDQLASTRQSETFGSLMSAIRTDLEATGKIAYLAPDLFNPEPSGNTPLF